MRKTNHTQDLVLTVRVTASDEARGILYSIEVFRSGRFARFRRAIAKGEMTAEVVEQVRMFVRDADQSAEGGYRQRRRDCRTQDTKEVAPCLAG